MKVDGWFRLGRGLYREAEGLQSVAVFGGHGRTHSLDLELYGELPDVLVGLPDGTRFVLTLVASGTTMIVFSGRVLLLEIGPAAGPGRRAGFRSDGRCLVHPDLPDRADRPAAAYD